MSSTSLWWRHLVNVCQVKAHLIGLLANNSVLSVSGSLYSLDDTVAAALHDSLYVVLFTACKVVRFVLTVIKVRLLLLRFISARVIFNCAISFPVHEPCTALLLLLLLMLAFD